MEKHFKFFVYIFLWKFNANLLSKILVLVIEEMNLAEVCRLCLVKSIKTSEELFFPIDEVFESKFTEITSVTLNSSERFPSTICISCVTEFEDFYNYRSGLIQKQKRLNLLLGIKEEKTVKSEIIKKQKVVHTAVQESIQAQNEEMLEDTNQNNPEDNKRQYDEQPDYEYEHIEYQDEHEHNRMIFEEVLENEQYEEEYEIEPSDQSKSLIKLAESEEYFLQNEDEEFVESTDECVEEVEHIEDEEIIFAISAEDMKEECIVVKSEASFLESVINERQKRKYVKQEKEKLFRCWIDDCNAAFSFRSTMKKHMNQAHLVICDKKTCLMCGQRFDEYSDFLNHVKKHTRKAECDICKLTFVSEEKMQAHRARVHKNDENERCFQCPVS